MVQQKKKILICVDTDNNPFVSINVFDYIIERGLCIWFYVFLIMFAT